MTRVLHVLPHAGGGAETYLSLLSGLDGYDQQRFELSATRQPLLAAPSIATSWLLLSKRMRLADIIHIHGDTAAILMLPLLRRNAAVWTTHGLHLLRRQPRIARAVASAMGRMRETICTSQAEADELAELAPALSERLHVVPNGVPLPEDQDPRLRAAVRRELNLSREEIVTLFLGELEQRKGPMDAIRAVQELRTRGLPVTLLLAGSGPLAAAAAEHAGDAIRVLGFRDDPSRLLAATDIFLLPSAREGHSFALLEAMAYGLPVITTDGSGNAQAVGAAGIVVPFGDPTALAVALARLVEDPQQRSALGVAARERVAREFTPERLRAGVVESYERALRAPGPTGGGASA